MMSAADRGHVNIVKALLAKGASVMKANRYVRCTEALHPPPRQCGAGAGLQRPCIPGNAATTTCSSMAVLYRTATGQPTLAVCGAQAFPPLPARTHRRGSWPGAALDA